jgi:hypothetical protein
MLGSFSLINSGVDSVVNGQREPRYTPTISAIVRRCRLYDDPARDDSIYNNIFIQHYPVTDEKKTPKDCDYEVAGTAPFDIFPTYEDWLSHFMLDRSRYGRVAAYHFGHLPVWVEGNAYFGGASVSRHEKHGLIHADTGPKRG